MKLHTTARWLLALPLALAACEDALHPGGGTEPAYDLVFDGEEADGVPRLFRVPGAGGTPSRVGSGYAGRRAAATADGRRIAFQTPGSETEPPRLMLVDAARPPAPLGAVEGLAGEVSWSPDGSRIAFLSQRDDAAGDVFVAEVAGSTLASVRNLTPRDPARPFPQPDRTPAWSPEGGRIAFTAYRHGGPALWVMAPDGTAARAVTAAGDHMDFEPSWSPDGHSIAFQRADATTTRIGIVPAAGGEPRFLPWPAKAHNPAWSPDGAHLAFSSDVDGDTDIYVVTLAGAQVTRIRRRGTDRNPAWVRR